MQIEEKQAKLLSITQKELLDFMIYAAEEIQEANMFSTGFRYATAFRYADAISQMKAVYDMLCCTQLDEQDLDCILPFNNPLRLMSAVWKPDKICEGQQKEILAGIIENMHKTPKTLRSNCNG